MKSQFRLRLLTSTLLIGAAMSSVSAYAQTADEAVAAEDDATVGQEIVVTGSLISNPNLVSSSPVSVVGETELTLRNTQNAEQIIRDLPGAVPGIGSAVNNGNGGYATVNLRNLESKRNLVLLDGNRIVPADQSGTVDLNLIPVALIERVDILTGGASTTYGADAVSGVVNFVTKSDFAGIDLSASQRLTEKGDGNYFRTDLTIGANFDDGRGNAVLSVGYQEADPLYQGDRDLSVYTINSGNGVASGSSFTSVPTTISFPTADLQVNPAGTALVPQYQGFNFSPYNIFETPFKRYNIYGAARYEVSDTVELYSRALFSKNSVSTIIAPSGIFGEELTIPGNNPYLPAGVRDEICRQNGIALGAACTSAPALLLPAVYRRTVEIGPRVSEYVSTVFDYRAGVKVSLSESIKLDVNGSYGESDNTQTQSGYVLRSRVQQALNSNNTTSCTVTTNNCVPLNLFGPAGSITPDQAAFLNGASTITIKTNIAQARALLSGDFGFSAPWAEDKIGFAIGAEYRNYGYERLPDAYALSPGELGGAGGAVPPFKGGYSVKEAFGELIAPLVTDRPGFHSLTLEAGARYSSYKVDAAGSPSYDTWTYKAGGSWEPVEAVKFRGVYQRAVRAPNIDELFSPVTTGLTNLDTDPCAGTAPVGNANLTLACINQGAPAVSIGTIQQPSAGQANATGGGNINIQPEKADTFTAGVVIQPKDIIPGFTLSVDYFNIKVNNAITQATPGDILADCFGSNAAAITAAQANSLACTSIRRSTANGRLSGSSATVAGLPQPLTNRGRLTTDGIDLSANYRHDFGDIGLNLNFSGTWTHSNKFRAAPGSLNRECVGYYSVNCQSIQPEYAWNQRTTVSYGDVDLSLLWRHISAVKYEPGLAPLFNGVITGPSPLAGKNINFNRISAYNYFDLAARFQVTENFELTVTGENVLNKKAPVVGANAGSTAYNSGNTYPSTYDVLGRTFNVVGRIKF